jgi:tetratricopeptide (TPR) repeat protein
VSGGVHVTAGGGRSSGLLTALVVLLVLAGSSSTTQTQQSASANRRDVTFTRDVAPILFANCVTCHRSGGAAPFSLERYADARRRATQIAQVTAARYMPPWKPESGLEAFVGERRLSDADINRLKTWAETGTPEGDAGLLPPLPTFASGWQLGQPDLVMTLPDYTLRDEGLDVFRNFVIHVPFSGVRFVRGFEFRPGSPSVHHANIRVDPTQASRRLDDADAEPGYEGLILHSADYPDGFFLGWTPGQFAPPAPRGMAWRLTGGTDFVVQLHMRPTGKPERVQPQIGLFFTNDAPVVTPVMLRLGRQNIDIAAGASDYRSTDSYTLPVDAQVQAIQPHSHYRARRVDARATLPDGSTRWLVRIPRWDFGWQDVYRYAFPFWLPAGTRIDTEYVFDNSSANPQNPSNPPGRAIWGFRSSDEMGDVWLQVLTRTDADRLRLIGDFRPKAASEDAIGYEMQIASNPSYSALHDDAAVVYLELGKPELAVKHFEASLQLHPGSAVASYNLGTALEAAGRMNEAAAAYEKAVAADPRYASARVNLGNLLLRGGDIDKALAAYKVAVDLAPGNADAHNNLGHVLATTGHWQEGIEHLNKAIELQPSFADAHFNLAEALLTAGRVGDAIGQFEQTLKLRPDWRVCLIRLSWTLSTHPAAPARSPDDSIKLAARAVELSNRSDPAAFDALAAAYARAQRFDEAAAAAATALIVGERTLSEGDRDEIRKRRELYQTRRPYTQDLR